jgi:hypothetical protein
MASRQLNDQRRNVAMGLCGICRAPLATSFYCERCARKNSERGRARSLARNPNARLYKCGICGEEGHNMRFHFALPRNASKRDAQG